jgi:hypothetical protein
MCLNCRDEKMIQSARYHSCGLELFSLARGVNSKNLREKLDVSRTIYSKMLIKIARKMIAKRLNTIEFIMEDLSANPNIAIEDVFANDDLPWQFRLLSANPSVTLRHVLDNPTRKWCHCLLSLNVNITKDHILTYNLQIERKQDHIFWCASASAMNPNITMDDIDILIKNGFKPHMHAVSQNINLTPADVRARPKIQFHFESIARNKNFFLKDLPIMSRSRLSSRSHAFDSFYKYDALISNPNNTIAGMQNHYWLRYCKNTQDASAFAKVTMREVYESKKTARWNFRELMKNSNITQRDFYDRPREYLKYACANPNITPEFIAKKKLDDLSPSQLINNPFIWHENEDVWRRVYKRLMRRKKRIANILESVLPCNFTQYVSKYIECN